VPVWLVTDFAEARTLLADPRLSKDHERALELFPPDHGGAYASNLHANMLHSDPPTHTRLRKHVGRGFTTRAVERLRSRIEIIADELLDDIEASGCDRPVDLIAQYAAPLPIRVIAELFGMPDTWFGEFRSHIQPLFTNATDDEKATASVKVSALMTELIQLKRREPDEDLMSTLTAAADDGDQLSHDELVSTAFLLIFAGYETTVHLVGNGLLALLRNPVQLSELRADTTKLPAAVEEFLRLDGAVNVATLRFASEPIQVGDRVIPRGDFVMISLLAANRDGKRFTHPDRLDLSRNAHSHVAFGHGIHHCVGAPLARLEGQIAIGRLLDRFDDLILDAAQPLRYQDGTLIHGLTALPVHVGRPG
ncbi:cytochrome P450 family protein, partial [Pseudactinotalea sp.]|uniref:cytochrome P450 family protein n=1 Tax=Pseudactinotalea sp. TaxID=1926260 RepID=UPI003B3AF1E5